MLARSFPLPAAALISINKMTAIVFLRENVLAVSPAQEETAVPRLASFPVAYVIFIFHLPTQANKLVLCK